MQVTTSAAGFFSSTRPADALELAREGRTDALRFLCGLCSLQRVLPELIPPKVTSVLGVFSRNIASRWQDFSSPADRFGAYAAWSLGEPSPAPLPKAFVRQGRAGDLWELLSDLCGGDPAEWERLHSQYVLPAAEFSPWPVNPVGLPTLLDQTFPNLESAVRIWWVRAELPRSMSLCRASQGDSQGPQALVVIPQDPFHTWAALEAVHEAAHVHACGLGFQAPSVIQELKALQAEWEFLQRTPFANIQGVLRMWTRRRHREAGTLFLEHTRKILDHLPVGHFPLSTAPHALALAKGFPL